MHWSNCIHLAYQGLNSENCSFVHVRFPISKNTLLKRYIFTAVTCGEEWEHLFYFVGARHAVL